MRSCGGAVLDAGSQVHTEQWAHHGINAGTRWPPESETLSTSLKAKEEMQRGDKAEKNEQEMGKMTRLYLNVWPVSWSSPAAGAMRIWGVVSWVTIIAAMAKEDPQVSMHEGRKSQTEARLARRISVRISHRPNFLPTTTKRRKRENHHSQLLIVLNSFPLDRLSSGS